MMAFIRGLTSRWVLTFVGVAVLASLALGDAYLTPRVVGRALIGRGDELARTVVWDIRLPRTLVGIAVGAGLAASGVAMQAFFRNALASPGLLGVSAGGALGAVAALALGVSTNRPWGIALSGFGFGLLFCAPPAVNRFRYWVRIRRPNRGLDRRIDSLLAEIDRLQAG